MATAIPTVIDTLTVDTISYGTAEHVPLAAFSLDDTYHFVMYARPFQGQTIYWSLLKNVSGTLSEVDSGTLSAPLDANYSSNSQRWSSTAACHVTATRFVVMVQSELTVGFTYTYTYVYPFERSGDTLAVGNPAAMFDTGTGPLDQGIIGSSVAHLSGDYVVAAYARESESDGLRFALVEVTASPLDANVISRLNPGVIQDVDATWNDFPHLMQVAEDKVLAYASSGDASFAFARYYELTRSGTSLVLGNYVKQQLNGAPNFGAVYPFPGPARQATDKALYIHTRQKNGGGFEYLLHEVDLSAATPTLATLSVGDVGTLDDWTTNLQTGVAGGNHSGVGWFLNAWGEYVGGSNMAIKARWFANDGTPGNIITLKSYDLGGNFNEVYWLTGSLAAGGTTLSILAATVYYDSPYESHLEVHLIDGVEPPGEGPTTMGRLRFGQRDDMGGRIQGYQRRSQQRSPRLSTRNTYL